MNRYNIADMLAIAPCIILLGLLILGIAAVFYEFFMTSSWVNIGVLFFSLWLVGGIAYLWIKNS